MSSHEAQSACHGDRELARRTTSRCSCGVPEYWVVNLPERCVEVYREPQPSCYAHCDRYEPGQSIRLASFSEVVVAVSDFLR